MSDRTSSPRRPAVGRPTLGRPALRPLISGAAALALGVGLVPALPFLQTPAQAGPIVPEGIEISEVYGGGGNSGATWTHDFVELRNTSEEDLDLSGWSLQYASRTGAFSAGNTLELSGTVPAGSTFLVQLAQGNGGTDALPAPDLVGDLALGGSGGVVALVDATGTLQCSGETCSEDTTVLDLVGWGGASTYAGSGAAPGTSNTTSVSRTAATGDNATDFVTGAPTPQNAGGDGGGDPDPEPEPEPEPGEVLPIATIQGTGEASAYAGQAATTEGVVTAVYATGGLNGYVIQTGGTGGALEFSSHDASDALFVYSPDTVGQVEIGQEVQVTGQVSEYYGSTQITVSAAGLTDPAADLDPVEPATLDAFPTEEAQRESLEHMLYLPGEGDLTVTDVYGTNRYGEVGLALGDEPYVQPGEIMEPSAEATALHQQQLDSILLLDDGRTTNFAENPDQPLSYLSTEEPVRVGAGVTFQEPVVLGYSFDRWRLQPTTPWTGPAADGIAFEDTRTASPDPVGGDLQIGTFNVLNYFTTLGVDTPGCTAYTDRAGDGTSVRGGCDPRGAWDGEDLERQQSKIVEAISTSGMDVVGLMEIENSARLGETPDEATASLVAALNERDGEGTWAYVSTADAYADQGADGGQDVITNAIIYKPSVAVPTGDTQVLVDDPAFDNAREPIGQVFAPVGTGDGGTVLRGEPFLFVVNHFKSKGSEDAADADLPEDPVQGNARTSRLAQAEALTAWVEETRGELDVEDVFLGGDFNAYTQETAMQVFYDAGYTDLVSTFDADGWSYSYDGMVGSLDHVVASPSALERVTGATDWSVNAPETPLALYSRHNTNVTELVESGPYASSDHNPLVLGLQAQLDDGPVDPGESTFSDVPEGMMFHDEITWAAQQGYVQGWPDGTYRPLEPVNRDAMAAFLYRMAGEPAVDLPASSPFVDVAPGDQHYTAIVWAHQEGITTGWSDGTFRPTEPIARDAMAAFVYRYAGEPSYADPIMPPFADVPADSMYATEIAWLQSRGISTGWPDRTYRPLSTMNRDAMAAFMYRMDLDGIEFEG